MEKHEFMINNKITSADSIGWEYSLQEGDKAGRTDDGTMWHDVVGMLEKVSYDFKDFRNEEATAYLINLLEDTDVSVTFYDLKERAFVTKIMYVSGDKIQAKLIDGEFYTEAFQIRFTTNKVE